MLRQDFSVPVSLKPAMMVFRIIPYSWMYIFAPPFVWY